MTRLKPSPADLERQQRVWRRIDQDIVEFGGWTVSARGVFPVRFECLPDLALVKYLRGEGLVVVNAGCATRFMPSTETVKRGTSDVAVQHLRPTEVEIWQVSLD